MSLLGAVVRRIDPKTVVNYFRRNLLGSGELGRKEINKIKGDLKNLSQEDRERLRTADLEDLTPSEVDLVMFGFVGFKDFGMPNKTIAQMKGNEFTTFKNKLNKIVDDQMSGKDIEIVQAGTKTKNPDLFIGDSKGSITIEKGREKLSPTKTKSNRKDEDEFFQPTLFNEGGKVSMLKPDYIDIDGDGNKTEPMKTAAKQRDGMAIGGISKAFSKKLKELTSKEIKKIKEYFEDLNNKKFPDKEARMTESELNPEYNPEDLAKQIEREYKGSKEFDDIFFVTGSYGEDFALRYDTIDEIIGRKVAKRKKPDVDVKVEVDDIPFAKGGDVDSQMAILMMPKEPEEDMLPDDEMEDEYLDFILDEALDSEEEDYLMSQLQSNEQLSEIFDKVIDVAQEFAGSGPVEGPGSGVSDSIPARLSDGEFVFTAKAVEEIGADNLMAMMKDAEMKADGRQDLAEGGQPEEEETVEMPVEKPASRQDIRVVKTTVDNGGKGLLDEDEISKSIKSKMMLDNRTGRHVQS